MKNFIEKFQKLNFNTKIVLTLSALAATVLMIVLTALIIRSSMPENVTTIEPAATETPASTTDEIEIIEDVNTGNITTTITEEAEKLMVEQQQFINDATLQICNQTLNESNENKKARLAPYIYDIDNRLNQFYTTDLFQTCETNLGTTFVSFDKENKTLTVSNTYVQKFSLASQIELPEDQRTVGDRYVSYDISIQQQPDSSWKVVKINGS